VFEKHDVARLTEKEKLHAFDKPDHTLTHTLKFLIYCNSICKKNVVGLSDLPFNLTKAFITRLLIANKF